MSTKPRFAPRRELGRTGFVASRLGIGDLADRTVDRAQCLTTLRRALDAGCNVIDTAPNYEDGYREELVGEALRGRGDDVFVIDKITRLSRRSRTGARSGTPRPPRATPAPSCRRT